MQALRTVGQLSHDATRTLGTHDFNLGRELLILIRGIAKNTAKIQELNFCTKLAVSPAAASKRNVSAQVRVEFRGLFEFLKEKHFINFDILLLINSNQLTRQSAIKFKTSANNYRHFIILIIK